MSSLLTLLDLDVTIGARVRIDLLDCLIGSSKKPFRRKICKGLCFDTGSFYSVYKLSFLSLSNVSYSNIAFFQSKRRGSKAVEYLSVSEPKF